ncbi:MAG: Fe-S cluster assembly protein SufB [Candidatus Kerfeldbacteria bacterium CG_4_10_14_0_8_um_filter_42_10]|uniref:Fe-S cluster assembly protein SufB n=1 Tax=Candidatus Kerfeldbacteria bacterium CG_4_10_14_0_8_um_filter_42_10 TaxID=2014248 RepID=A0A2M7RGR9_9BACT|nr:MAG: Fe-S cluster assembly protein SufB [Candidatus Kerfeldbacteria bacterium CG_4_10_14_0_8_um_filter_42_10]
MAFRTAKIISDQYQYGFAMTEKYVYKSQKGLDEKTIQDISWQKKEPDWMTRFRLQSYRYFKKRTLPAWGGKLKEIDFNNIYYYVKPVSQSVKTWDELPSEIKETYDKIGVPEAEKNFLAGVGAQYDSEMVYHSLVENLEKQGIIFSDLDSALKLHPDLVKEYFSTLVSPNDNKFAALNSAVWSGGSFIYIPKGVSVELPLQAYFRINAARMGQFERTLIIAEEGSYVHYLEGCTAPIYTTDSLHAAVVEIIVKKGARVRYTTIQNWSNNVYNLVTKRMRIESEGIGEWIDCNLGSKLTMKYPACYLMGPGARGELLSMSYAGSGQHQDAGGKMIHAAPHTSSRITAKSISQNGGRASYRGLVRVNKGAKQTKARVVCDALILDKQSRSDTYPNMKINESETQVEHEATVSKIGEEQLFYLMSRGIDQTTAEAMIINGFIEPIVKELPLEYAVEMNRLIQLQMDRRVG